MRCCATCRGHRSLHWRRSRFPANGAAPRGGRRLKAEALGLAGRDGFAGDAVNPSVEARCGIHAADTPANPSRPATDSFRVRPPRKRKRRSKAEADRFATLARSQAWLGSGERPCAENCRRRGGLDGGGVSRMGPRHASGGLGRTPNPGLAVCAGQRTRASGDQASMDGFTASPAIRPTPPTRSNPAVAVAVAVAVALLPLQVQGCKPCQNTYVTQPAITSRARIASHSSSIRHTRLIASRRSGNRCHTGNSPASV